MKQSGPLLGVNIDHVATLRQARGTFYPDPIEAALIAQRAGADLITVHLREDRRHIQEEDVIRLSDKLEIRLNLEMALTPEMLRFAKKVKPSDCCIVPEKRNELTTEGGLNVLHQLENIKFTVKELQDSDIAVSLFIDPNKEQIDATKESGASIVELHTGCYANAVSLQEIQAELTRIKEAAIYAHERGLQVNAGHGLNYSNVIPVAEIPELIELNIGHAIVAQALTIGFKAAVVEMIELLKKARN